jgi:hypothetical protein
MSDSLAALVARAEQRADALKRQIARDERAIEKARARAARADANVEKWWFGSGGLERLFVAVGATLRRRLNSSPATRARRG